MKTPLANEVLEVIAEAPEAAETDLLSRVQARTETGAKELARSLQPGVVIGIYRGRNEAGDPLVDFPANPAGTPLVARSAVVLTADDVRCEIVLVFDSGDLCRPIVLGRVQPSAVMSEAPATAKTMDVRVDGQRVTIEAEKEVLIKCGDASISLTRAGKILIRGKYVLSRSSGANRLKGASVEIN